MRALLSCVSTCILLSGCSMPPEPTNDNTAMNDNGGSGGAANVDACVADLNARFAEDGGEWQLNVPGPDTPGRLSLLTVSGTGTRITLVDIVVNGTDVDPGYTTELALDLDIQLSSTSFTLITSGLADDASTTRVFVEGNPATATCQDDGRLSPRLLDLELEYSIQFGDEQLIGTVDMGVLR